MAPRFPWIDAAIAAQALCEEREFAFAFIGGVAVQRWGEPRVTKDIDLTLFCGFGNEAPVIEAFLERFEPRVPDAAGFAEINRVLLLNTVDGIPIDVALGGFPFEDQMTRRARKHEYLPGVYLRICTAEDLVVMKVFAGRPHDWSDVERILIRQKGQIDWTHIRRELKPLAELKEAPEILDHLERLRVRLKC
jgi:hypothetical protein